MRHVTRIHETAPGAVVGIDGPAYRAECGCGFKGLYRSIRSNAEASSKLHVATQSDAIHDEVIHREEDR